MDSERDRAEEEEELFKADAKTRQRERRRGRERRTWSRRNGDEVQCMCAAATPRQQQGTQLQDADKTVTQNKPGSMWACDASSIYLLLYFYWHTIHLLLSLGKASFKQLSYMSSMSSPSSSPR